MSYLNIKPQSYKTKTCIMIALKHVSKGIKHGIMQYVILQRRNWTYHNGTYFHKTCVLKIYHKACDLYFLKHVVLKTVQNSH